MEISEAVSLPNSNLEEEEEKKEFELPSSSSPPPPPLVESDHTAVILETLEKEFRNLVLEEERKFQEEESVVVVENEENQEVVEKVERDEIVNQEVVEKVERDEIVNQEGEEIEEEILNQEKVEKDEIVNQEGEEIEEEILNQEKVEKDEIVNQEREEIEEEILNQEKVDENVKAADGWTVEENGHRDGWGVESNGNHQDGWGVESNEIHQDGSTGEENDTQRGEGKERSKKTPYPSRPEEPDCAFYLKTGTCGFGSNCKFNHPPKKKHKVKSLSAESEESVQVVEEKAENPKRVGRLECKYYLTPGGCKFGKACRYHHPREKTVVEPPAEFNFLGLPIRPGERECPFYMRTGSCKFATNCRFNHPDPTAGGSDIGYDRSSSIPLHASSDSQSAVGPWSIPQPSPDNVSYLDSSRPYMPMMPQSQGVRSSLDWNGYQAPVNPLYAAEGNVRPQMVSAMNGSINNMDVYSHHMQQMPVDEFPERPGQKECMYYMNTGDCKYKSACRFHHPKARVPKSPSLSPLGLPLRPDQIVCTHFSRYGICKYGAACKYDHTPNPSSSAPVAASAGPVPYYHNAATYEGANMVGYRDGNKALVQQSM